MREFFFRVGTGEPPKGYKHFHEVPSTDYFIGVKGHANIHLYGEWEKLVTPEQLRHALLNLSSNEQPPTVTVSI